MTGTSNEQRQSLLRSQTKADFSEDKEKEVCDKLEHGQEELHLYELVEGFPQKFKLNDLDIQIIK